MDRIELSGEYPFTRGCSPVCYRGRYGQCVSMQATHQQKNQTGATVIYWARDNLACQWRLICRPRSVMDADDPLAEGEVGKVGVSISSLEDMLTLFQGIPLDKVSTSMTINAPAAILLAMYIAVAKEARGGTE